MARKKMGLADLKLLVDIAWANRDGQVDFVVPDGCVASAKRLYDAGYLMFDPTRRTKVGKRLLPRHAQLTNVGHIFAGGFIGMLENGGVRR